MVRRDYNGGMMLTSALPFDLAEGNKNGLRAECSQVGRQKGMGLALDDLDVLLPVSIRSEGVIWQMMLRDVSIDWLVRERKENR